MKKKRKFLFGALLAVLFPFLSSANVVKVSYGAPPYDFVVGPYFGGTDFSELTIEFKPTFTSIADTFWRLYCTVYDFQTKKTSEQINATFSRNYKDPIRMFAIFDLSDYLQMGRYVRVDFTFGTWLNSHTDVNFSLLYQTNITTNIAFKRTGVYYGKINYAVYSEADMAFSYPMPSYSMYNYKAQTNIRPDGRIPLDTFNIRYGSSVENNMLAEEDLTKSMRLEITGNLAGSYSGLGSYLGGKATIPVRLEREGDHYVIKPKDGWAVHTVTKRMVKTTNGRIPSGYVATEDLYFPTTGGKEESLTITYVFDQEGRKAGDSLTATMEVSGKASPLLGPCHDSDYCVGVEI